MANTRRPPSAEAMVHPAVRQHFKLGEGSSPAFTAAAAPGAAPPHVQPGYKHEVGDQANPFGPEQISGFGGYAQNPLEDEGRRRIGQQFAQAPLGGYVRDAAAGLGLQNNHAILAERGLAGLTAVGIGVPAFMAAVQQLSTPPDQNTIPL